MKKVRFLTLGCKVNQYETQAMRELLLQKGFSEGVEGPQEVVVINTCTVTEAADRENRYWIRRLRRENPDARLVVTGCWVERNRKEIESLPEVDLILTNQEKQDLADRLFHGCGTPGVQAGALLPSRPKTEYAPLEISSFQGHARAFVKVQDGCNHACSFCKVVLVRGRSRSRPLADIIEEVKRLADSGFREIVLTGIQLGAYGSDFMPLTLPSPPPGERVGVRGRPLLVSVLEALSQIPSIERIRLSSIEPTDVKPELIEAMKELPHICPQLHIPLQSGDNEILRRMNRRYTRDFYETLLASLRQQIPDFCLSMDVMAGFPGEEERHFQNTLSLIQKTRPIRVHAFPYSRRPGTRAAVWEEVPASCLGERMKRLIAFSNDISRREKEKFLGRSFPVLVERASSRRGFFQGHTAHYLKVYFQTSGEQVGRNVRVKLVGVMEDGLAGQVEKKRFESFL